MPNTDLDLIPVSLLTGFLGSGKTTLLNHLMHQPALRAMVMHRAFGEMYNLKTIAGLLVRMPSHNAAAFSNLLSESLSGAKR